MAQFAAYISRELCNPRFIFPRINGPNIRYRLLNLARPKSHQCYLISIRMLSSLQPVHCALILLDISSNIPHQICRMGNDVTSVVWSLTLKPRRWLNRAVNCHDSLLVICDLFINWVLYFIFIESASHAIWGDDVQCGEFIDSNSDPPLNT